MSIMGVKGSITLAGGVLVISAVLAALESMGLISGDVAERGIGIVLGLVVIAYGNEMPKILVPMEKQSDPARKQALQRFSGWVMVIGGIGYLVSFAFLPMDYAAWAAVACGGVATLTVLARCLMARTIA